VCKTRAQQCIESPDSLWSWWALSSRCSVKAREMRLRTAQDPPNFANPRAWWRWMTGNITKKGIQLDLEWMMRVGIGGFQNFDTSWALSNWWTNGLTR
jgi:alpha-L-rhamnosidase